MSNMGMPTEKQKLRGDIHRLRMRIKELEAENERITDAYKELITKLNPEDRADINISP